MGMQKKLSVSKWGQNNLHWGFDLKIDERKDPSDAVRGLW